MISPSLPPRLSEIIAEFELCEGREKLELLLQYSENLPALPNWLESQRDQFEQVEECMTPVFVYASKENHSLHFYFDVPAQSPTVRGYAAILEEGLQGATPEQVLTVPADFYHQMGLNLVLTHQRLNGIAAILAHMKQLALQELHK